METALTCKGCSGHGGYLVEDRQGEPAGSEDCSRCGGGGVEPCVCGCGRNGEVVVAGEVWCGECLDDVKEAA